VVDLRSRNRRGPLLVILPGVIALVLAAPHGAGDVTQGLIPATIGANGAP